MSSYNYLNGYHSASHPLYKIIRNEFGYSGILLPIGAHLNHLSKPLININYQNGTGRS